MNRAQMEAVKIAEERCVLLTAARHDVFGLGELWREMRGVQYGRLSRLLLEWWREDGLTERFVDGAWRLSRLLLEWWREDGLTERFVDGAWREGFVFSAAPAGWKAVYRWKE